MKNMRKLNIYTVVISLLVLSGCGDFLDTESLSTSTVENYYKTPAEAYAALVGCYDGVQALWSGGVSFPVASEIFSDNAFGGTGNGDGFGYQMLDEFDKSRSPSDLSIFGANWANYYKAIYRCNILLGKLDQVEWGTDETLKATYESEARFLRASMYFDMVRLWGNIPLLTEASAENIPQADPETVYAQIAEDLKFASENLQAITYANQPVATHGRVTKWAAEALIGRVYLYYTGYYQKADLAGVITKAQALAYLEDVISNSGHGLVSDFANLWPAASVENYAGEDNKETIFAIKYSYTSDYTTGNDDGNKWLVMLGMRSYSSYPYGKGWGGGTVNPNLWNAYSDDDTRKVASIISIEDEGIAFDQQPDQREYTGYTFKKYTPMINKNGESVSAEEAAALGLNSDFQISQFQDYVVIRYADVLLMAAELGSGNAQTYFDQVRQRAYGANFSQIPVTQENLMEERRLEFALEGIRYWDLLRQGIDVAADAIAETTQVLNGGVSTTKQITAAKILETKGLQQIPNAQISLSNGVLKQNTGW
jgi:starch-binding outer membrane protein, SusD/RagB family